ncbi:MAG: AMP-binding protein [Kiritimatiellaeota bacterium]|nr:AMP-binding protein [Kiritimatiellota bacterium]
MSTIRTILLDAAEQKPEGVAFRWKAEGVWKTKTFTDYKNDARAIAEGVAKVGGKRGSRVALIMENRYEWVSTYLGLACAGFEVVPIDAKLQEREISYILQNSESFAVFTAGRLFPTLMEIARDLPALKHVIAADGAVREQHRGGGVTNHDYAKFVDDARADSQKPDSWFERNAPVETDIASIIYTSGTTGRPKGATLTHGNFTAQLDGALQYIFVNSADNFLLVLPLHHVFAFTANFMVPLCIMCEISMVENLRTIAENARETSPTVLLAVPLLADKMLNAIMAKLRKNPVGMALMKVGLGKVVGKKIVANLGGRLRIIICGGAASDVRTLRMFNKFGVRTFEGYGLTETAPIATLNPENRIKYGTIGKALPNCEVRIADPNKDGVGEIQVRGPIVMRGYFRNEAATKEAFDGDWFCTGDLGKMDAEGYVTITGRKKSLIVNREGKNIYPEEVEGVINSSPYIFESIVVGARITGEVGEKVGVIVVPDMERIEEDFTNKGQIMTDEQIVKLCKDEVVRVCKELADYKRPRRTQVRFEALEKTTTHKVKRYLYSMED